MTPTASLISLLALATLPLASAGALPAQADQDRQPNGSHTRTVSAAAANPLAGRPWGVFKGGMDAAWAPYSKSTGARRALLAKIALRPKTVWFTSRLDHSRIRKLVRNYVENSQAGNREALVQMAIFGIKPWNREACDRLPTMAERRYYKTWINLIATELGNTRVLLVIQPDAPFALCSPNPAVPLGLMKYAVDAFAGLPRATVYIEAGAADWMKDEPAQALRILVRAGVANARGFAFNSTHYDSTARQIRFGTRVVAALAQRGIPNRHFVINTSSNGKPFKGYTYTGPDFDNARLCNDRADTRCATLGIPPTPDVTNPRWGLSAEVAHGRTARRRLPVDRQALALPAGQSVQHDPRALPRPYDAVRLTSAPRTVTTNRTKKTATPRIHQDPGRHAEHAQMCTTGQVRVRVMPSRFCTFDTTSLPSSSTLRASARTITS